MSGWTRPKEYLRLNWDIGFPPCVRCKRSKFRTLQLGENTNAYCIECVREALEKLEAEA